MNDKERMDFVDTILVPPGIEVDFQARQNATRLQFTLSCGFSGRAAIDLAAGMVEADSAPAAPSPESASADSAAASESSTTVGDQGVEGGSGKVAVYHGVEPGPELVGGGSAPLPINGSDYVGRRDELGGANQPVPTSGPADTVQQPGLA